MQDVALAVDRMTRDQLQKTAGRTAVLLANGLATQTMPARRCRQLSEQIVACLGQLGWLDRSERLTALHSASQLFPTPPPCHD
jgi:hypothetical protein